MRCARDFDSVKIWSIFIEVTRFSNSHNPLNVYIDQYNWAISTLIEWINKIILVFMFLLFLFCLLLEKCHLWNCGSKIVKKGKLKSNVSIFFSGELLLKGSFYRAVAEFIFFLKSFEERFIFLFTYMWPTTATLVNIGTKSLLYVQNSGTSNQKMVN